MARALNVDTQANQQASVSFIGHRWGLFWVLLLGYIAMVPSLGMYRFWQVTAKRRYYWSRTIVDGDGLEYTGDAVQLLLGFLIALAFFLPLYIFFFYLSTQSPQSAIIGYGGAAVFLYFLAGYAGYRGRRFRLSRTLWRGIRFGQTGSAWSYAMRRFLWSVLVIVTAGLAYPHMTAGLWRYRIENTWYGDRRFKFTGSWRAIARPYYTSYAILLVLGTAIVWTAVQNEMHALEGGAALFGIFTFLAVLVSAVLYFYLRARFVSKLMSCIEAGNAKLTVRVRATHLFGQHFFYALLFAIINILFLGMSAFIIDIIQSPIFEDRTLELSELTSLSWVHLSVFGALYLVLLGIYALLSETILGLGYWRLVARGALIDNADDLKSVRARGEESPLAGEGLADALNVGAY